MRSLKQYRDSVNLLQLQYSPGYTHTENGVTFIVNDDYSVSVSGTANANTFLRLQQNINLLAGTYYFSGGIDGTGTLIQFNTFDGYYAKTGLEVKEIVFTENTTITFIEIRINSDWSGEYTFYPMIAKENTSYEPYGKIFIRDGFETFKESINANGKQITASFELLGLPYSNNLIFKVNPYFDSANSLLGTSMKCLEIEMETLIPVTIDAEITNLKFGVKSSGEYEYINYGTYIVNKYEWDIESNSTTLLCYDKMIQSMIPYDLSIDYSNGDITILDLLQRICERLGWALGTTEFTNSNVVIDEEKYDNTYTFRSVLEEIGQVAGGKIAFKDDDILYVLYPTETNEIIDESNLKTLTIGKKYGPVNSLVISRTPQEDNIYRQDEDMINAPGGKNLFDKSKVEIGKSWNGGVSSNRGSLILEYEPNKDYTISLLNFNNLSSVSIVEASEMNSENIVYIKSFSERFTFTHTMDADAKYLCIQIQSTATFTQEILDNIKVQLEEGEIATEYEPFTPQGVIEVKIENNQLMDSHREDFIDNLFDRLKGLTFYTYELESYGIGYLELYDLFTMKTHDDKEYSCLFLYDNLEITQGLSENSKADLPEETETNYKVASESDRVINKTILQVDKQDQEIRALITSAQNMTGEMDGMKEGYDKLTQQVEQTMTSTQIQTLISETISNGVDSVTTSTGYTLNKDGLTISKTGEEMKNVIDNTGMFVKRDNENILTANNEGVNAINLTARQYLTIGKNSRFEDYLGNRTACFHVGGDD